MFETTYSGTDHVMGTPPQPPTDDDYWKPQAPGAIPPPPPEYLQGSGEYIPQFDCPEQAVRPTPPVPRYQPYAHIPVSSPPEGKGLAITALIFAVLSLGVPCLFGWAGIFLGAHGRQKGTSARQSGDLDVHRLHVHRVCARSPGEQVLAVARAVLALQ
ncbi:hypothetical protein [Nocardia sp. NPDC004860]|uniref:hypothetical protein n=1 Tax=Nocardia sp. NPDC004860 TaxID=3154557 RepID=UPI0033A0A6EC